MEIYCSHNKKNEAMQSLQSCGCQICLGVLIKCMSEKENQCSSWTTIKMHYRKESCTKLGSVWKEDGGKKVQFWKKLCMAIEIGCLYLYLAPRTPVSMSLCFCHDSSSWNNFFINRATQSAVSPVKETQGTTSGPETAADSWNPGRALSDKHWRFASLNPG